MAVMTWQHCGGPLSCRKSLSLVSGITSIVSALCFGNLQRTRRPYRIILHGESIGGMVATHLARNYPVDALVCDRTFCSLDATAARLMVRPGAGAGAPAYVGDVFCCSCCWCACAIGVGAGVLLFGPHPS